MYRIVDVNYYDRLDSIKIVGYCSEDRFTRVKKLYKKSRMHNAVVSVTSVFKASISTNKEASIVDKNTFVLFHK